MQIIDVKDKYEPNSIFTQINKNKTIKINIYIYIKLKIFLKYSPIQRKYA